MITPESVYGDQHYNIRIEGDCWIWLKPNMARRSRPHIRTESGSYTPVISHGMRVIGQDPGTKGVTVVCRNDMCVHPEHGTLKQGDVGRMMFIRDHVRIEGECWIWEGTLSVAGLPHMPVTSDDAEGKRTTSLVGVPAFQWRVENLPPGFPAPKNHQYRKTCGNALCVAGPHLEIIMAKEKYEDYE